MEESIRTVLIVLDCFWLRHPTPCIAFLDCEGKQQRRSTPQTNPHQQHLLSLLLPHPRSSSPEATPPNIVLTQILRIRSLSDQLLHLLSDKQFPLTPPLHPQVPAPTPIQRCRGDNSTQIHRPSRAGFEPLPRRQIAKRWTRRGRGGKVSTCKLLLDSGQDLQGSGVLDFSSVLRVVG